MDIEARKRTQNSLGEWKRMKIDIPVGLLNRGLNCYFNATMQAISSCPKYVQEIEELSKKYPILKKLHLFRTIILNLHYQSSDNTNILANELFIEWNKSGQHDSFEILSFILNKVYDEIKQHIQPNCDFRSWINVALPMKMVFKNKISCKCGLNLLVPLQSDLALHISIVSPGNKKWNLQDFTDRYFDDHALHDFICDNKNCSFNEALKSTTLQSPLPNTICVHLQRTNWNGSTMIKLNNFVEFFDVLRIKKQFCSTEEIDSKRNNDTLNKDQSICNENVTKFNKKTDIDEIQSVQDNICNELQRKLQIKDYQSRKILTATRCLKNNPIGNIKKDDNNKITSKTPHEKRKLSLITEDKRDNENLTNSNCKSFEKKHSMQNDHFKHDLHKIYGTKDIAVKEVASENYYLKSVIVHHGSVRDGHYFCYRLIGSSWFLINDSFVMGVDKEQVFSCEAYILFYEKQ